MFVVRASWRSADGAPPYGQVQFCLAYAMDVATQREELIPCMACLPEVSQLGNYCPNALPVEGRGEIRLSASGCPDARSRRRPSENFQSDMNPDCRRRVHLFIYFMALA
ncbi:MAG TPA: hypothetical protein VMV87_15905 [Burkholderiales bacterium]|nr:hypothetical protein [Burkholderiales bacterium]